MGNKMKEIVLSKDKVALVDDADYDFLSQWKWYASLESRGTKWYAVRWSRKEEHGEGKRFKIRMHRAVMGLPSFDDQMVVDHKDGNSLNNQRINLEVVTQEENMHRVAGWKGSRTWDESQKSFFDPQPMEPFL
jgi:HNH endonuclease